MTNRKRKAFSQVEVLLSIALYGLVVTGVVGVLSIAQRNTAVSGERARAVALAEEGIEAVTNIRNASFASLVDGTHGLSVVGNQWSLSGASDVTGIFTRQVTIATTGANSKQVTSTVTWQQDPQRTGTVSLVGSLSNWKRASATPSPTPTSTPGGGTAGNNLGIDISLAKIGGPNTTPPYSRLRRMTLSNLGSTPIAIDKIQLTWVDLSPNVVQRVTSVRMQGSPSVIWDAEGAGTPDGPQYSGTTLDVNNYTLNPNSSRRVRFWFDQNMVGTKFTIVFIMTDGSTRTLTNFIPPPCDAAEVDCTSDE